MSLTERLKIFNNYNISSNMTRSKKLIAKEEQTELGMNKNTYNRLQRLRYIASKAKGEKKELVDNIVDLYKVRKISQSDKLEDLLWDYLISDSKVYFNRLDKIVKKTYYH